MMHHDLTENGLTPHSLVRFLFICQFRRPDTEIFTLV
jgi:hypothetical protein